jgi:transposase
MGLAGELEQEAKGELVRALARVLTPLVMQIAKLTARIEHEVAQLADGHILMSFPRAGRTNAAQILADSAMCANASSPRSNWPPRRALRP